MFQTWEPVPVKSVWAKDIFPPLILINLSSTWRKNVVNTGGANLLIIRFSQQRRRYLGRIFQWWKFIYKLHRLLMVSVGRDQSGWTACCFLKQTERRRLTDWAISEKQLFSHLWLLFWRWWLWAPQSCTLAGIQSSLVDRNGDRRAGYFHLIALIQPMEPHDSIIIHIIIQTLNITKSRSTVSRTVKRVYRAERLRQF